MASRQMSSCRSADTIAASAPVFAWFDSRLALDRGELQGGQLARMRPGPDSDREIDHTRAAILGRSQSVKPEHRFGKFSSPSGERDRNWVKVSQRVPVAPQLTASMPGFYCRRTECQW